MTSLKVWSLSASTGVLIQNNKLHKVEFLPTLVFNWALCEPVHGLYIKASSRGESSDLLYCKLVQAEA